MSILSDTEVDLDTISEIEGAIPCEVEFLHGSEVQPLDEPAKFILVVSMACTGPCGIEVPRVTVLICQPCLDFANGVGWRLGHRVGNGMCGSLVYVPHVLEPINQKGGD